MNVFRQELLDQIRNIDIMADATISLLSVDYRSTGGPNKEYMDSAANSIRLSKKYLRGLRNYIEESDGLLI